jgi:hypothetical protein
MKIPDIVYGAVTAEYPFHKVPNGECLFAVRGGIPLSDAFDQLTRLLDSSISTVELAASEGNNSESSPGALWQSAHVMAFAYALVQSMHAGHDAHLEILLGAE